MPAPTWPAGKNSCLTGFSYAVKGVLMRTPDVKTTLTKVKIVALFTLVARAGHGAGTTAVTSHAWMKSRHALHLADQPGPVALHREIYGHISPIGADRSDDAH